MKKLLFLVSLMLTSCSGDDDNPSLTWNDITYNNYTVILKVNSLSNDNINARMLIRIDDEKRATTETVVKEFEMGPMHAGDLQSRYTQNSDACKIKASQYGQDDIVRIENKGGDILVEIIYTIPSDGPQHIISFTLPAGETHIEDLPCRIENPETFFNQ